MNLSPQQSVAAKAVEHWLKNDTDKKQVFKLFGYAGVGKSAIAKQLAEHASGDVYFAAFTGKAANVLKVKGCPNASTIHSLIYIPVGTSVKAYEGVKEAIQQFEEYLKHKGHTPEQIRTNPRVIELRSMLTQEREKSKKPRFKLNMDSPIRDAGLLVLDECSTIDVFMGEDLESFGCPILVLGDPAQLPPIKGAGFFTLQEPDILLTEVHRQAADNPIIHLATLARNRQPLPLGNYGESKVISRDELRNHPEYAQEADQVLCGTHKTRIPGNARLRELAGRTEVLPMVGDKLVSLRNMRDLGIFNGSLLTVEEVHSEDHETMNVTLKSLDMDDLMLHGVAMDSLFYSTAGREEIPFYEKDVVRTDYGNVLTVHRYQGSQSENILLIDESSVFRGARYCHQYTGITRAAERIVVAI